jgi:hypothetical protein
MGFSETGGSFGLYGLAEVSHSLCVVVGLVPG